MTQKKDVKQDYFLILMDGLMLCEMHLFVPPGPIKTLCPSLFKKRQVAQQVKKVTKAVQMYVPTKSKIINNFTSTTSLKQVE